MQFITDILDDIATEFQSALYDDLQTPEAREALEDFIDNMIMTKTNLNINNAFIKPYYTKYKTQALDTATSFVELFINDEQSMDIAADMVKENVNTSIDSFKNKLKQRLENRG